MNRMFLADPVAFAQRCPLLPQGNHKGTLKNKGGDFYSVASDERIVYCDILKPGKVTGYPANTYLIDFSPKSHSNWFPAYWLPWDEGLIYKCTLKDGRSGTTRFFGADVNVFFTAALDGCSVMVEGVGSKPSIYHANASNPGGDTGPGFKNPRNLTEGSIEYKKAKMEYMREQLFKNTTAPKRGIGNRGGRVLEGGDYMDNFIGTAPTDQYRGKLDTKLQSEGLAVSTGSVSKTTKTVENKKVVSKIMTQDLSEIKYHYGGTVFGVRTNNLWRFYYQKRVTAEVWRQKPGTDANVWSSWEPYEIALSMSVEKFWPDGGGTAISR